MALHHPAVSEVIVEVSNSIKGAGFFDWLIIYEHT
jgi:hypothetical protein